MGLIKCKTCGVEVNSLYTRGSKCTQCFNLNKCIRCLKPASSGDFCDDCGSLERNKFKSKLVPFKTLPVKPRNNVGSQKATKAVPKVCNDLIS